MPGRPELFSHVDCLQIMLPNISTCGSGIQPINDKAQKKRAIGANRPLSLTFKVTRYFFGVIASFAALAMRNFNTFLAGI